MPLRPASKEVGQWWGWLLVPRECASGLPREARDDSQWPADPTRAYGGGSLPARREGPGGNRHKLDWGGTNSGCPGLSGTGYC